MKISKKESELRRALLPYGAYIGADGTETLFDRSYAPILQRDVDGKNLRKGTGWIEHVRQVWFYDDYCSPHYVVNADKEAYYRCANALIAFIEGEPITPFVYEEH